MDCIFTGDYRKFCFPNSWKFSLPCYEKFSLPCYEKISLPSLRKKCLPDSGKNTLPRTALNQWKYLVRYLLDGRIECNNNRAERSIKPFVINRKNFLFADSVAGARATAVLHSITETAKENRLNPHEYLSHIFRTAAGVNLWENTDMIISLLPENAPPSCRVAM